MSEISGIAVFRHPHSDEVTLVVQNEGTPAELLSCAELNGRRGFVIAPFEVKSEQPILLIRPDRMEQLSLAALADQSLDIPLNNSIGPTGATRTHYAIDFASEHAQLELGTFQKIVLARCVDEQRESSQKPLDFFLRACELYPRLFIALVWTAKSGCWLTATPEILLKGEGTAWQTVALAGTMKLEGEQLRYDAPLKDVPITWTTKNIQEQRVVEIRCPSEGCAHHLDHQEYSGTACGGYLYRRVSGAVCQRLQRGRPLYGACSQPGASAQ